MWTRYAITDPLDVDASNVKLNATVGGTKKSFTKTGTGQGSISWSGLSLAGPSTTMTMESVEPVSYNISTTSHFKRESTSIAYQYTANSSNVVSWRSTFLTQSTGTGYNFTAGYNPRWHAVTIRRDGMLLAPNASIVVSGGNITVTGPTASGNHTWEIRGQSYNTVSSLSFDQAKYYRGQTFSVTAGNNMTPVSTDLVQYYNPAGTLVGSTIGSNFPLGTYTAVYWCENGTDAGWASATVPVTDNGSISVHVTDSLLRAIPGISIKIKETGAVLQTNLAGDATFINVEYGNYTMYIYNAARGINESRAVVVNAPSVQANHQLAVPWLFSGVVTLFNVVDAFGAGFRANLTIADATNTTVLGSAITTAGGQAFFDLDEGAHVARVYKDGLFAASRAFTVIKDAPPTSILVPIDAYPGTHTSLVAIGVRDNGSRWVPGLSVDLRSTKESYTMATGLDGKVTLPGVYWGFDELFNITISDAAGPIDTFLLHVNSTTMINRTMPFRYRFTGIQVRLSILDKNGKGFGGLVSIVNGTSTEVHRQHATSTGNLEIALDEGTYYVQVLDDAGTPIGERTIIVEAWQPATFAITTSIDAYPASPPDLGAISMTIATLIAIVITLAAAALVSRSKAKKKEAIIKQREHEIEQLKAATTEEDIKISKEKRVCIVHKGAIEGFTYICPACGTFYCQACHASLVDIENKCWSCGTALDKTRATKQATPADGGADIQALATPGKAGKKMGAPLPGPREKQGT